MLGLSVLLWSLTLVSTVAAIPGVRSTNLDRELGSPTEQAKRSFISGSTTCYYTCPPKSGYTVFLGDHYGGKAVCEYQPEGSGESAYCDYDDETGAFITGSSANPYYCPTQAAGPTCGNEPDESFRKRSLKTNKTRGQEAIAKRQYKFKRTASE